MRILLPKGKQQELIENILSRISVTQAARLCNLSERTIRDWRREKFLMHKNVMELLCKTTNIHVPKNFEEKSDYWYANPHKGAMACIKKYGRVGGNPEARKIKWYEWWNSKGKFIDNPIFRRKLITKPSKSSELAEFIGIMLGDGGMSPYKRQICITLNNRADKEYIGFVGKLIEMLFSERPKIYQRKYSKASVVVSSTDLVEYLIRLGLKTGNKTKLQVDIPNWIKNNKAYSIACVRGLIDTDGCIFTHSYRVNRKVYKYKKLVFVSYSQPLRKSVYDILKSIGMKPRFFSYRDVRLDSKKDMSLYFKLIGSSNTKHLNKYYN